MNKRDRGKNLQFEEEVVATMSQHKLLKRRDKIMVGVSGGPDSVALLHVFSGLSKEYRLKLVCVHLDHQLRPDSAQDRLFVERLCEDLNIECFTQTKNVSAFACGDSLEQTARKVRFDFFMYCAREFKIKKLALGHNKDDVAETVLMRIIRGTALCGLRSIQLQSQHKGLSIIRPLLAMRKKTILDWLQQTKRAYCVDKTNRDEVFLRNKMRHSIIPILEECNPNVVSALANLADIAARDYDYIHREAMSVYLRIRTVRGQSIYLDVTALQSLHSAIFGTVIRHAISDIKGNTRRFELRHSIELKQLVFDKPIGSIVHLPDCEAQKEEQFIVIRKSK